MSKIKNMPGVAWLVIGVCVTALVLPSAAFAAGALKFTGIEGPSISPSGGTTNTAVGVTSSGQLKVSAADPNNFYASNSVGFFGSAGGSNVPIASPPSGDALVIQTIHVDVRGAIAPSFVSLYVLKGSCISGGGSFVDNVDFASPEGMVPLAYEPGFTIPAGSLLCASSSSGETFIQAYGYSVPAADAPIFQAHRQ